jgi:hypothetical protein
MPKTSTKKAEQVPAATGAAWAELDRRARAQTKAGATLPPPAVHCSFCFKSQHAVKKLISGYGSIFICDECVSACNDVIAGRSGPSPRLSADDVPTERLLERLQPIEETIQGKGNQLQWVVDVLRSRGVSWAHIGTALGISRQSAWERFT